MKKLITSLALVAFLFSASTFAQEIKKEGKAKTAKTEKATSSTEAKKECHADKKCCASKAAAKKA